MKNNIPISEIMTKDVITLKMSDTLVDAEKLFKKHKIRHIPVVFNKEIVGMLSLSDILRLSFADVSENEKNIDDFVYNLFSLPQVMAKNVFFVTPFTTIKEVSRILIVKEFHALPVVGNGKLVGIVTTTDLINYLVEQL